ncbi:MAG: rod shape-determining protein MreC [Acidimicrobiia bacterium]|nr:rod shape-determining protein MreC [Acidimicrobiia bacterium]
MVVYRRDARRRPVLLIVVFLSLVLVTVDSRGNGLIDTVRRVARDVLQPAQSVVDSAFDPLRNVGDGITGYGAVKDENALLKKRVAELEGRLLRERAVGSEVNELGKLLDLPTIQDATGVAARVIGGAPGNFERTVVINKGISKGVDVGQPVVAGNGLVGKVTEASSTQATVTLLDSPGFGVGVRLENTNERGIAEGRTGEREMRLNFLSKLLPPCGENSSPDTCISEGEIVFTSAVANAAFPPDIPVAKVTGIEKKTGELESTVSLRPLVSLNDITYVKVLRWPEPTGG